MPENQSLFHPLGCPVSATLSVIGGRWKPIILFLLMKRGVLRFGELQKKIPAVTQRMLSSQLRELEKDGVILRTAYAEMPPRVEYCLTEYGHTLKEVLYAMHCWGEKHKERYPIEPRTSTDITE